VDAAAELEAIVRGTPSLVRALEVAREVDAPDWLIGAGAVRNAVWDRLHGFTEPTPPGDVDLAFFDPADLSREHAQEVEAALRERAPELPWEATNQAAVHLWYPDRSGVAVEPLRSSAEAVATWPETATAVALHLDRADRLTVVAPFGLDDLFGLVFRHNPARAMVAAFNRRAASKRIAERWPRVTVVPAGGS
jgi:hypothetical protein